MFDRNRNRALAIDLAIDDGIPAFPGLGGTGGLTSPSSDDLPITAVMNALAGRESDVRSRREEIELSIRTHWAALCRLVVEYNRLADEPSTMAAPKVAKGGPTPIKVRGLVPPAGRGRHNA